MCSEYDVDVVDHLTVDELDACGLVAAGELVERREDTDHCGDCVVVNVEIQ